MNKIISAAIWILFFTVASSAWSHPPNDIKVTFDPKTKTIHAFILHDVTNTENHFIKKVAVAINGKEILEHSISKQDNKISQEVRYMIPDIKDGDVVSIEATCNIMGKLKKEFIASIKQ